MSLPRHAYVAGRLLGESRRGAEDGPPPSREARARAVAAIEAAIVARARARRRARWYAAASVAAVVLGGVGVAKLVSDLHAPATVSSRASDSVASPLLAVMPVLRASSDVVVADRDGPLPDGTPIARGQRIIARAHGHATLAFATGTELAIEERGDLTIDEGGASQRFTLGAGAVKAHVAKLSTGQTFVVATSDAEVEVRGTVFRVAVVPADPACGDGSTTRVDVVEGAVVVRSRGATTTVGAGERWPRGCTQQVSAPAAPAIAVADPKKPATASSQLADQNDLFAEAVAAKRRGAVGQALATFERFLAKYPSSPLAESAMAERMRLLRGGDRAAAQAAARLYIARFPSGFARADARAILAEAP